MENNQDQVIETLNDRVKIIKNAMNNFTSSHKAFAFSKEFLETYIQATKVPKSPNLNDLTAHIYAVFCKTQQFCRQILKNASDGRLEKYIRKIDSTEDSIFFEGNQPLFEDLVHTYNSQTHQNKNYDIDSLLSEERIRTTKLFNQLIYNTKFFFFFVDDYLGSIIQYFKYVNPKFLPEESKALIGFMDLLRSIDSLREPSQHLVSLFYSSLIASHLLNPDKEYEKKITEKKSVSFRFQIENIKRCMAVIEIIAQQKNESKLQDENENIDQYEYEYDE